MVREFNRGDNTGSAYFHVNQHNGLRWSMADAFLHPVARRANLTLRTRCAVQRLTFASDDGGGVAGLFILSPDAGATPGMKVK